MNMTLWDMLTRHNEDHPVAYCDACREAINFDPMDALTYRIQDFSVICECGQFCPAEPHLEECRYGAGQGEARRSGPPAVTK